MSANNELSSDRQIIAKFQEKKSGLQELYRKITELEAEIQEHQLVLKALEPLQADRKCFRQVGGVLVERTVEEVRPAVQGNLDAIMQVVESLSKQFEMKRVELQEFQEKHKIKVKGEDQTQGEEKQQGENAGVQGVLV